MKKTFLKFLPLMAAVLLTTSCSKDEDNNASQQPEKKGIPFAVKVDTKNSLSKIGFADDGTNVNISFSDNDVNSLTMSIYSNEKTINMGGGPEPILYGQLVLTSTDGVFEGTLDMIPYYASSPIDDGEELLAIIQTYPENAKTQSNVSLADLLENSVHQYKGTFCFDGSTPISNEENQNDPYYLPIPKFDEDHLPTVRLTEQSTYFEFTSDNLSKIYMAKVSGTYENLQEYNLPLWIVVDKDQYFDKIVVRKSEEKSEETLLYSKLLSDIERGVIYSVKR